MFLLYLVPMGGTLSSVGQQCPSMRDQQLLSTPYDNNTWSSPFTIGYLNVGRRRLVDSRSEVVNLVLRHCPDILFLGDLVIALHHIGRLKKTA